MGYQVEPLPAIRKSSPQNSYDATANTYYGPESQAIQKPVTPIITLSSVGNSTIVIGVTNHASNSSYIYGYEIFVNELIYGTYVPEEGVIKITGLPNNYLYKIKIKAIAGFWASINAGGALSAYRKSDFSNEVQGTPTMPFASKSAPSMNRNQVDISYVSSNIYANCFPTGTSTYGEIYEGEFLDNGKPIYFQPNMLVGSFTAEAVLRARLHYGGKDLMDGGGIDYTFSDIKINVDTNPFTDIECFDLQPNETYSDGDTLSETYDNKLTQLKWYSEVSPAADNQLSVDHFNIDIASQLKREFVLARPYIAEKLRKYLKNNIGELFKSADALRAFSNVINLNVPIKTSYRDYILPYEGLIYIKPHIIASTFKEGDNGTTTFSYKMIDSNGHTKFVKENVSSSIILAPTQTADSFTFSALKPIADASDVYGPAASEFATPLNLNTG